MKELHLKLYSFSELSDDAKKKVMDKYRLQIQSDAMLYGYGSEWENTLKEFSNIFDITVYNWHVCDSDYSFRFRFDHDFAIDWNYGYDGILAEELKGRLLLRYLNRNIVPYTYKPRYYFGKSIHDESGKYIGCKKRISKILKDDCCPLTGCCYDYNILNHLFEYLKKPDMDLSLHDLVEKCLDGFFKDWEKDWEYCASDEFVAEELEYNQYEDYLYFEDGTKYDGPNPNEFAA